MEAAVKVAEDVHVGAPPGPLSDWVMRKVHFHGFAGLATTHNGAVFSPEFSCFGHRWRVAVYPGGQGGKSMEGYVAVFLYNRSPETISAHFTIVLKHPTDQAQKSLEVGTYKKIATFEGGDVNRWGMTNFAKRETLLSYLNNGTLTLEIHLRTNKPTEPAGFVPSNPCSSNLLKGFNDEEMSDVAFEVGGEVESAANRRKRGKTITTRFHAFHAILRLNAPSLSDMCRPGDEAAVPINGIEPEVFKIVLYFCYGGTISEDELAAKAKAIIEAADRFGIINLKLQAEALLTEKTDITVDNMLDNLLYANSKNLALFQEKIMDFVAENGDKILGKVSFDDVPGNLMSDLLTAVTRGMKSTCTSAPGDDLTLMRVGELRKRLHDKGLCIDGSREAMIALLKGNLAGDETVAE